MGRGLQISNWPFIKKIIIAWCRAPVGVGEKVSGVCEEHSTSLECPRSPAGMTALLPGE